MMDCIQVYNRHGIPDERRLGPDGELMGGSNNEMMHTGFSAYTYFQICQNAPVLTRKKPDVMI